MEAAFWNGTRASGVPDTLDLGDYRSVVDVFERSCKKFADRPGFSSLGVTITYGELDRLTEAFATYLCDRTDLKPGDRIAIQLPNILQYPIAVFGALRAGLVVVNTNPLYTAREMHHQFQDAGVRALVYLNIFGHLVEDVLPDTGIEFLIEAKMGDMMPLAKGWAVNTVLKRVKKVVPSYSLPRAVGFHQALKLGRGRPSNRPTADMDGTAILQYTGGTTGISKGAMLTHRNLIANMQQVHACLLQHGDDGTPLLTEGREIMIAPLPLYHIYAFTANCMCMMLNGHHNVLITNPRDIDGFIKELKRWRFSGFVGINTLFSALMDHPQFATLDFSGLKVTLAGGTALASATAERWRALTGCAVAEAYGLTECSPLVCANPFGGLERLGTVGLPAIGTALKVIADDGAELGVSERGELCVKGPQVMRGYWNCPQATAEVLDGDGWLKTGDVALIDADGYVRIVDRKKDVILVSGFNVYPQEIEEVVISHPFVANCAAVGIPDERSGEAVKLFVVPNKRGVSIDELLVFCKENLTGYKVPKYIVLMDALPMTPVGKLLRRELRNISATSCKP